MLFPHCKSLQAYQCLSGYSFYCEDCDAYNNLVPEWQHIRRAPKGGQAVFDVLSTLAFVGAVALTAAGSGAGSADGERRDLGWGVAAEAEVEAEAPSQVLAVMMAVFWKCIFI